MNYADFLRILQFIVQVRIQQIKLQSDVDSYWHFVHDLLSIKILCLKIMKFQIPDAFLSSINNLFLSVKDFLSKANIADLTPVNG